MDQQLTEEQEQLRKAVLQKGKRLESQNCFQTLFFTWIRWLLIYGSKVILDQNVVPAMPQGQHAKDEFVILQKNISSYQTGSEGFRIVKGMIKSYKKSVIITLIAASISTTVAMLLPNITKLVINYVESDKRQLKLGLMLLGGILILKFIQSLAQSHMFYHFALFGYNVNNGLSMCIFTKALRYPTLCSKDFQLSQLINYTQVDAQRLTNLGFFTSAVIFFPIQLGVGIYLMYSFIGVSFLAGIGIILIMAIFILINSRLNAKANVKLLAAKDRRMKTTTEIFNLIRFIKVNAWEKYFFKKLNNIRNQELKHIRKTSIYGVIAILFFWITTPLILSTTFAVFILRGELMTPQKAFTTIILFNILQFPIRALPQSITQLTQIWVSLKRIGHFLYTSEINNDYIVRETHSDNAIEIRDGSFYWDLQAKKKDDQKDEEQGKYKEADKKSTKSNKQDSSDEKINTSEFRQPTETMSDIDLKQSLLSDASEFDSVPRPPHIKALKRVNIDIKRGKLTIILGDIGSGKSSLLYSIVGEMKPQPGHSPRINISGSMALVVQKAWIMSCSVQENILMTLPRDQKRFDQAIHFACFEDDLKKMPDIEKTMIGEKGINVSGGQKARLNLARALYADRDIYLFDDIISAVDVHVGNFIVKETILNYLSNKTRVLVTHAIVYAKYADYIIVMRKGEVVEQGTYQQVRDSRYFKEIQKLDIKNAETDKKQKQIFGNISPTLKKERSINKDQVVKLTDKLVEQLMLPEDKQRGDVSWETYKTYIRLNGGWIFPTVLIFFMSCWMTLSTLANIQIQRWCQNPNQGYTDLWIYASFSIGSAFFAFARGLTLVLSGIKQGTIVHKKMIKGLLYASIPEFFDRVPTGRILNRVSKDLRQLDEAIGFAFGNCMVNTFVLLGTFVICVYASTIYVVIPILFFLIINYFLKAYYMKTQRECVRLENVSNSPIVSGFSETINGLPTIRAYHLESQFIDRQANLVNINKRNRMSREAMECWFAQRLAWLSYFINISAIAYCLLTPTSTGSMAGLLLAYAFTIDASVINLIYSLSNLQTKMISVERVANFMSIQPETGYVEYTKKWNTQDELPVIQITQGTVKFDHLSLCYRAGLPPVLRNLNFVIRPGEKIGVVGRTGAGKSTITSSILRLVEPTTGAIYVDDKSIMQMPLKDLRSSITLIAQEPVLIEATLRQNLDPRKEHSETVLLQTLKKCCLQTIFDQRQGLDTKISDAGDNLSIGEKQLVCIARAILRNSKLVLIDEATANIDVKADALIQQAIKECFKDATVITIAHRIQTIMNSDRILVMSDGQIAEFDTPQQLIDNQMLFYQLYTQAQNNADM